LLISESILTELTTKTQRLWISRKITSPYFKIRRGNFFGAFFELLYKRHALAHSEIRPDPFSMPRCLSQITSACFEISVKKKYLGVYAEVMLEPVFVTRKLLVALACVYGGRGGSGCYPDVLLELNEMWFT
jgi:hypothetical protein